MNVIIAIVIALVAAVARSRKAFAQTNSRPDCPICVAQGVISKTDIGYEGKCSYHWTHENLTQEEEDFEDWISDINSQGTHTHNGYPLQFFNVTDKEERYSCDLCPNLGTEPKSAIAQFNDQRALFGHRHNRILGWKAICTDCYLKLLQDPKWTQAMERQMEKKISREGKQAKAMDTQTWRAINCGTVDWNPPAEVQGLQTQPDEELECNGCHNPPTPGCKGWCQSCWEEENPPLPNQAISQS